MNQTARYWSAVAIIRRAEGDLEMANRYAEYAHHTRHDSGAELPDLRGFGWSHSHGGPIGSGVIDAETAVAAINTCYVGHP